MPGSVPVARVAHRVTAASPGNGTDVRRSLAPAVVVAAVLTACGGGGEAALTADDVVVERCERLVDHPVGLPYAVGTAVNRGAEAADLRFRVLFQGADGTRVTTGSVELPDVPAGQVARWQTWGTAPGAPSGCDVAPR